MEVIYINGKREEEIDKLIERWHKLGTKYSADRLCICDCGEEYPNVKSSCCYVSSRIGFLLEWDTDEDDIRIFGDGSGKQTSFTIEIDEPTYLPESVTKLKNAIDCLVFLGKNKEKYIIGE